MRRRPDWWPRFEAVDWALVALFLSVLAFYAAVIVMISMEII